MNNVIERLKQEWSDFGRLLKTHWLTTTIIVIVLASLFFYGTANARDLAYLPNQAGGEIVLTTSASPGCTKGQMLAYSRGQDGTTITGCWLAGENYVLIRWSATGTIKLFRYEDFEILPRPMPGQPPKPDMRL